MYKRRDIQRRAVIPPTRKTGTFSSLDNNDAEGNETES